VDYDIGQDILSIDNKINYDIYLNREKTISCIKDIGETSEPIDKSQIPSISIYIVQKGDLLWDVAKRYNTTIEDILSSNNLESSYEIKVGDKIIIEKSLDKDLAAL
jgi:LysM repeat protein